ncbi:MAG: hypothetical protein WAS07_10190 [Micropruina sp.]|nr:hypothetical protein [Micropruina sp.]
MAIVITIVYVVLLAWGVFVGVRQVYQGYRAPESLLNPLFRHPIALRLFAVHLSVASLDLFVIGPWAIANKSTLWYWGGRIALLTCSLPIAAFFNRNAESFGPFIGRWVRLRNFFEYGLHIAVAALPLEWTNYYLLHWWLVAYRFLDVGPRRLLRTRPRVNWVVITLIYLGAFAAVWFHQVLFATLPAADLPDHVNAPWETAVVVGGNLGLAIFVWLSIARYAGTSAKPQIAGLAD